MTEARYPVIDTRVKHFGMSKLRELSGNKLREFSAANDVWVIREGDQPLAVIVPYALYVDALQTIRGGGYTNLMYAAFHRLRGQSAV